MLHLPNTELFLQGKKIMDYGCGSGVLALLALKLGAVEAKGMDIVPNSVLAAQLNAKANRLHKSNNSNGTTVVGNDVDNNILTCLSECCEFFLPPVAALEQDLTFTSQYGPIAELVSTPGNPKKLKTFDPEEAWKGYFDTMLVNIVAGPLKLIAPRVVLLEISIISI